MGMCEMSMPFQGQREVLSAADWLLAPTRGRKRGHASMFEGGFTPSPSSVRMRWDRGWFSKYARSTFSVVATVEATCAKPVAGTVNVYGTVPLTPEITRVSSNAPMSSVMLSLTCGALGANTEAL